VATVGKEHNIIGANPRLLQLRRFRIIMLLDCVVEKDDGGYVLKSTLPKPFYNKLRPLMSMEKERESEAAKTTFSQARLLSQ